MSSFRTIFLFLVLIIFFSNTNYTQTFDGEWTCQYATIDDQPNSTGYNTPSIGVISENTFVALVRQPTNSVNFLVGYSNADSINGRLGEFGYGSGGLSNYRQLWSSGFEQIEMLEALDIEASPSDSLIYVANNDAERNILVFKLTADSVITADYRMISGADSLWAIDLDAQGRVYVSSIKDTLTPSQILVFEGIQNEPQWGLSTHSAAPLTTITMPEPGEIRGVTVNPDGTIVYASNFTTEKIYCFIGDPVNGYTLYNGFNFLLTDTLTAASGTPVDPGPWGLNFMPTKNLLFVACAASFLLGDGYEYGKIYTLNPNTGEILDTIDTAGWNFLITGAYNSRPGGTAGNVSGYTSTYNVDFDENFNLYDQSYYGWTVDKWVYSSTLPTIPITIVGIEKDDNVIPSEFSLTQNYPNPFNPTTTIEFSVAKNSDVNLSVYSITGELVTTLVNSTFEKGSYKLSFDASKLASGTYIYTLKTDERQLSKKMTLIK